MMKNITTILGFVFLVLILAPGAQPRASHYSVGKASHHDQKNSHNDNGHYNHYGLELNNRTKKLLKKEMRLISSSMTEIMQAMAAGEWPVVAKAAKKIHKSNLLTQELTPEAMRLLKEKLPPAFIKLDQRFHYFAGMLSHVAHERDHDLVNFYFYKMNEACMTCHKNYANERFPGLSESNKHEAKHGGGHH